MSDPIDMDDLAQNYLFPRFLKVPSATLSRWAQDIAQVAWAWAPTAKMTALELGCAIGALMWRESGGGIYLSPANETGTGDGGHGRGLMQIDDRSHQAYLALSDPQTGRFQWQVALFNIEYAVERVFIPYLVSLNYSLKDAFSAYNRGVGGVQHSLAANEDPDVHTTGKDYGRDVVAKMQFILNAA